MSGSSDAAQLELWHGLVMPVDSGTLNSPLGSRAPRPVTFRGGPAAIDMTEASSSVDYEHARLTALAELDILDSPAEHQFDDIVAAAAGVCETPIALVSFVDADRQWFKARVGLDVTETPRDISFCAHAIEDDAIMEIPDAHADARFAGSPLVVGEPHIAFYAGAPIVMRDGFRLGTVCVIDRQPRALSEVQSQVLGVLRDAVVRELELRRLAAANDEYLFKVCAWCARVQDGAERGEWMSADEFVRHAYPVSHGMCPACMAEHEKH